MRGRCRSVGPSATPERGDAAAKAARTGPSGVRGCPLTTARGRCNERGRESYAVLHHAAQQRRPRPCSIMDWIYTPYTTYYAVDDQGNRVAEGRVANDRDVFAALFSAHPGPR